MKSRRPSAGADADARELLVTTEGGVALRVRHAPRSPDGDIVEFYPAGGHGPISSYTKATFLTVEGLLALRLGVPEWSLDEKSVDQIKSWLLEGATGVVLPFRAPGGGS